MKKLLILVIVIGFGIMIGAAGSADTAEISFLNVLLLELLGIAVILFGTSALMHYKRYVRRSMRLAGRNAVCSKMRCRMSGTEKELC